MNFRQVEETHLMENIIFNELRSRGFEVDVGVVPFRQSKDQRNRTSASYEIDFAAEKASLREVKDFFKKIIVVKDVMQVRRDEIGITTMSIYDFLLRDDSLDL